MWFTEIAGSDNFGLEQLDQFVHGVEDFLASVINKENEIFSFLWEDEPKLRELALETFSDVEKSAEELRRAISKILKHQLISHGLVGRPMKFKLRVLASIERSKDSWANPFWKFAIHDWLKRMFTGIDAILDSLIQAAGGAGGFIMEFKKALSSLVKTI